MKSLAAQEKILYRSSNGSDNRLVDFQYALFNPDTSDNGLWVPVRKPTLPREVYRDMAKMSYGESSFHTFRPWFTEKEISSPDLQRMTEETYHWDVPIKKIGKNYIADHGVCPSLSFKDGGTFGNRMLVVHFTPKGYTVIDLGSTSGDTGPSDAMSMYEGRRFGDTGPSAIDFYEREMIAKGIPVFITFPLRNITELQKRQMTTLHKNIYPIGIETDKFDLCQKMRDDLMENFARNPKTQHIKTITGNSKGIGRFLSMLTFWDHLSARLAYETGSEKVNVYPGIGNGSHFTTALYSRNMGAPIGMVCPISNDNFVIPRYVNIGKYEIMDSVMTDSSAMDIGNPTNAARFAELFDGVIDTKGNVRVEPNMEKIRKGMRSACILNGEESDKAMRDCYEEGFTPCPHGAVAYGGMKKLIELEKELMENPNMCTNTANPVKFPKVVSRVLGFEPELPENYKGIFDKEERCEVMGPNDVKRAKEFIMDTIGI